MTSAVFVRPAGYPRFCRLLTIGVISHVTACLARITASDPVILTAVEPPPELLCSACAADLTAKRSRVPTLDLRPCVRSVGAIMDVEVEGDELAVRCEGW